MDILLLPLRPDMILKDIADQFWPQSPLPAAHTGRWSSLPSDTRWKEVWPLSRCPHTSWLSQRRVCQQGHKMYLYRTKALFDSLRLKRGVILKVFKQFHPDPSSAVRDWPALLQQHHISPTQPGQVVGHGGPHDASTTDHHTGLAGQRERLRVPTACQAPRRGPEAPAGQSEARLWEQQPGQQGGRQSPGAPHAAAHHWAFCGRTQTSSNDRAQVKLGASLCCF